jgi:hypothetical protein
MRRYLIVANQTLTSPQLVSEILERNAREEAAFHLLVPASRMHGTAFWTEGSAHAQASDALATAQRFYRDAGVATTGEVGDESPVLAIGDVLRREKFHEIIVSTLPASISRWLKLDLPHRIERHHRVPVTHIVSTLERVS